MKIIFSGLCVLLCLVTLSTAQGAKAKQKPRPVIFAVLNSGSTLEPIAYVDSKKLVTAVDGASEAPVLKAFHITYFKPKTIYPLVFGGAEAGTVTIKSSNADEECSRHTAEILSTSPRARLKGNVMALAVAGSIKASINGTRRLPTPDERSEIEALVRNRLAKEKIPSAAAKKLSYQNLTAVDVDNDGVVELIGSYWVAPTAKTRALLFFIAEKVGAGKFGFGLSDFKTVEEKDTMSEDISSVDTGIYHELLLDLYDYDADGVSEIFTYSPSFEGTGFNAYRRENGKWTKAFEGSNYRCGY